MQSYETLKLVQENDVLTVTLHGENQIISVSNKMIRELIKLADWLREDRTVKYVVFTNEGKFFSVGADLNELNGTLDEEEMTRAENIRRLQILGQEMMSKLENLEQISIAAIKGSAYGAGVAIALTTDFRFMTDSSVFNLPETNVGLFLTWGCTARLVKSVGALKAKELIMLCEDVSAEECYQAGLINKVVSANDMEDEVRQLIEKLRTKGEHSIRMTKKLVNASVAVNFGDIFINEPELVQKVVNSGETKEKVQQFVDSRKK